MRNAGGLTAFHIYLWSYCIVTFFILLNMFLAILNKTYSDVVDNGVDDPMAVEFRSTVAQYWRQTKDFLMFWHIDF